MTTQPTWDDDVAALFADPSWVQPPPRRATVASGWKGCMDAYGIELDDYDSVRGSAVTIYEHLASREMPLTTDETQFWPPGALRTLRAWIEQGMRRTPADPITRGPEVPGPPPPQAVRVRRNILDLDEAELAAYRAAIEKLGATSLRPDALWQQLGYIHSDWCLHYQEAFLLWHRAHLLYFEALLGMPIPYWNFMSPEATVDAAPGAGLVKPFCERTYLDPRTGAERPNPLRFAVAKDGRSKACSGSAERPPPESQCRYVQRDPVLYTTGETMRAEREQKLALIGTYQQQVFNALRWPVFSTPEGAPGYPWANITSFNPPPPDSDYPHRHDFDGLYEQPHDNFHGWVGPDMADNAYAAFDPVFWSYHANIDRVFEEWLRAHPASMFTANYPLRPFAGPLAATLARTDPDELVYTTIGDMAKDSRALGYDYAPPAVPDARGRPLAPAQPTHDAKQRLYVVFPNVRCTLDSYTVDVFVNLPDPGPDDMRDGHATHYAGRMTRLGMGVPDDKGRCSATGVTRVMDATHTAELLGLKPGSEVAASLVVTDLHSGRTLTPAKYGALPGFAPVIGWGGAMPGDPPATGGAGGDCH